MAKGTYSVRAAAAISRRGEGHARRRAGLVFGESEMLVSTNPKQEGAVRVTEEQLDAILHDSNLRDPESPDSSTPGLRAKEVAAAAAAQSEAPPATGEKPQGEQKPPPKGKAAAKDKAGAKGTTGPPATGEKPQGEQKPDKGA
jgi:hypothetical protein